MNVKRFTARTSRDALNLVRQAFGKDAVVLSTRPCAEGIEVLAMPPEAVQQLERVATPGQAGAVRATSSAVPAASAASAASAAAVRQRTAPAAGREAPAPVPAPTGPASGQPAAVAEDAERLAMSTLSFQDYVRERMLRRRKAELDAAAPGASAAAPEMPSQPVVATERPIVMPAAAPARAPAVQAAPASPVFAEPPVLHDEVAFAPRAAAPAMAAAPAAAAAAAASAPQSSATARRDQAEMMSELRSMKGLIEERFGALAFMEKLQRQPRQALLSQKLLDCGFSPALIRKLVDSLPSDTEEIAWAASVLERNLVTGEAEPALEDAGGVYAMIGSTGVGKTTSTAKLAAAFATRHGAANLGLITLDAYRVGAHEQLRTYGRILGVPVHTAHDRASLEDLLDLLSGKKMVLIDTAGMPQRDSRTAELLDMVSHRAVQRLLVVNAAAQGETIEDVLVAYRASTCRGIVLSKIDEAVKIGPAVDALIRHRLKVLAVANGQRVPEDWHRLSSGTLVQRALRGGGSPAWRLDPAEVNLVFAGASATARAASFAAAAAV